MANKEHSLIITGNGDVLDPEHGIAAIGSGGSFAYSAAKALKNHSNLNAEQIVKESLTIAADICIYTNQNHVIETISW